MSDNTETAILAGGCFWGVQELLRQRDGVISTRVGYTGGENEHPTYRNHPGHAEAVEIVFDPERISYRDILEFFFQIHDPTTKDRQGNDIGSTYRSEIFYTSDEQRQVAEDTIADVDASGLWPGKVVTEISEAVPFWEAEPEHQDYLQRYPNGYTCHFPRPGWKLPTARPRPDSHEPGWVSRRPGFVGLQSSCVCVKPAKAGVSWVVSVLRRVGGAGRRCGRARGAAGPRRHRRGRRSARGPRAAGCSGVTFGEGLALAVVNALSACRLVDLPFGERPAAGHADRGEPAVAADLVPELGSLVLPARAAGRAAHAGAAGDRRLLAEVDDAVVEPDPPPADARRPLEQRMARRRRWRRRAGRR